MLSQRAVSGVKLLGIGTLATVSLTGLMIGSTLALLMWLPFPWALRILPVATLDVFRIFYAPSYTVIIPLVVMSSASMLGLSVWLGRRLHASPKKVAYTMLSVFIVALMISSVAIPSTMAISATQTAEYNQFNNQPCTYYVFTDGTNYYAQDCATGAIAYGGPTNAGGATGTSLSAVFNGATATLSSVKGLVEIASGKFTDDGNLTVPAGVNVLGASAYAQQSNTLYGTRLYMGSYTFIVQGVTNQIANGFIGSMQIDGSGGSGTHDVVQVAGCGVTLSNLYIYQLNTVGVTGAAIHFRTGNTVQCTNTGHVNSGIKTYGVSTSGGNPGWLIENTTQSDFYGSTATAWVKNGMTLSWADNNRFYGTQITGPFDAGAGNENGLNIGTSSLSQSYGETFDSLSITLTASEANNYIVVNYAPTSTQATSIITNLDLEGGATTCLLTKVNNNANGALTILNQGGTVAKDPSNTLGSIARSYRLSSSQANTANSAKAGLNMTLAPNTNYGFIAEIQVTNAGGSSVAFQIKALAAGATLYVCQWQGSNAGTFSSAEDGGSTGSNFPGSALTGANVYGSISGTITVGSNPTLLEIDFLNVAAAGTTTLVSGSVLYVWVIHP